VEQSLSIGADKVIDYTKENFSRSGDSYDLILAINGNSRLSDYKRILNPNGIYVMVGGALSQIFRSIIFGRFMSFGSRKMHTLAVKSNQKDLQFLAKLAGDGKIKPFIESRYSLENTAEAMRYLNEGHAQGKIVTNT
jgi:NADPH:quinone reductase-like Zn-dependent oxidoreductase